VISSSFGDLIKTSYTQNAPQVFPLIFIYTRYQRVNFLGLQKLGKKMIGVQFVLELEIVVILKIHTRILLGTEKDLP